MLALKSLGAGLRGSSMFVLAGGVLTAVLMMAALEYAFASGRVWQVPVGFALHNPADDWTQVLWAVKGSGGDSRPRHPVYLLGGSSSREAVDSNQSVSEALSGLTGSVVRFVNLGTRNQTLAESLVLLDNLPDSRGGTIVVGMQPMFLADSLQDGIDAFTGLRYPLDSPSLAEALGVWLPVLPAQSSLHVQRFRSWMANYLKSRVKRRSWFKSLPYTSHIYAHRAPLGTARLNQRFLNIGNHMRGYYNNEALNLGLLNALVSRAKHKGYRVLLVGLPRNPRIERTLLQSFVPHYHQHVIELADAQDIEFVDLNAELSLPKQAFFDHIHLVDSSRPLLEHALVRVIHRHLGGE